MFEGHDNESLEQHEGATFLLGRVNGRGREKPDGEEFLQQKKDQLTLGTSSNLSPPKATELTHTESMPTTWKIFRVYLSYVLLSGIFFLLTIVLQGYIIVLSDGFYNKGDRPLPDRVHELVGDHRVPWAFHNVNTCCTIYVLASVARLLLLLDWKIALVIATRFFWCVGIMYVFRGLAIIVTTLPNPRIDCSPIRASTFEETVNVLFRIFMGSPLECTDMIVSGHTLFVTSVTMGWLYYSYKTPLSILLAVVVTSGLYVLLDVAFYHYTIDIVFGFVTCVTVWGGYHFLVDIAAYAYYLGAPSTSKDFVYLLARRYKILMFLSRVVARMEGLHFRMSIYRKRNIQNVSGIQLRSTSDDRALLFGKDPANDELSTHSTVDETLDPLITSFPSFLEEEQLSKFIEAYIGKGIFDFRYFINLSKLLPCKTRNRGIF